MIARKGLGFGKILLGLVGLVGLLMLLPAGPADTTVSETPRALSTSPELIRYLDNAVAPKVPAKTPSEVVAELASEPEPGSSPVVGSPALSPAVGTTEPVVVEGTGPRELIAVRSAVNMRSGPSTNHATLFVLQPDEQVAILARDGNWAKVSKGNGATGWVYARFLGPEDAASEPRREQPVRQARVEQKPPSKGAELASIRLRAAPSTRAQTVLMVEPGTPLRIAERRNGWARVVVPGGMSGWVRTGSR